MAESTSIVERVKQQLDAVEIIGAVVPLRKSGKAYRGLCPFHGERTPSFYVFPESGTYKCFGCGEGGDLFSFVEKQQGLDFREALSVLAERAGIVLEGGAHEGEMRAESAETTARKRLRALNEAAAIWFHHQLLQFPDAQYARSYLDSRGVSGDSIATWRLGFAPDGDRLSTYLREQGYTPNELIEAGLAREREEGHLYDYFRTRLIFPIRDARGQTIAFGGRELGGGHPKYLNTPQTALFDKSATLYGFDLAREGIRKAGQVVVVEGYMDAIVPHQYGFKNVVAVIGSAITEKHIRQIKKLTTRVALALDPDAAGESAMVRGIAVAREAFDREVVPVPAPVEGTAARTRHGEYRGMVRFEEQVNAEITVVRLPPHEDPDEFVRRTPEGWRRTVAEAQPLIDFLIEAQTAGLDLTTPHGKMAAAERLLPVIAELRDRTLADEYIGRLAQRVRLDRVELARDLAQIRRKLAHERRAQPAPQAEPGEPAGEEQAGATVERVGEKSWDSGGPGPGPSYSASGAARPSAAASGAAARLLAEEAQEEYCLGLLLEHPAAWAEVYGILGEGDFAGTETRALYAAWLRASRNHPSLDSHAFLTELPAVLRTAAERVRARVARETLPDEDPALAKAARLAAYRLKRMRLKAEMAELDYLEHDAEGSGDADAARGLLQRKQQLLMQRRALDAASGLHG
ncbi:MAG TPA: DNA primase [Ktedonobacterales bacterium]